VARRADHGGVSIAKINITGALQRAERLLRQDKSLSAPARAMFDLLIVIINLLVRKFGGDSTNSSLPPSQDPHRARGSKRQAPAQKRRPGGQNGHEGTTLQRDPHPDRIETIAIDRRTLPAGRYQPAGHEARQVIDLEIHKHVTEYRGERLEDEQGRLFVARFPAGVTRPVQYGNGLKADSVYQSQQQLIPYERICDYFRDQCGLALSAGSVFNFNQEAFELLAPFEAITIQQLIIQRLLHADETGVNVNGEGLWLHSLSNEKWTLFFVHARRGAEAMQAMGVLAHFRGTLCHDHWKAYFQFTCQHALCNAHHLRELKRAWEDDGQGWAQKMHQLLLKANDATTAAGGCLTAEQAESFRRRYRSILTSGERECPSPDAKDRAGQRGPLAKTKSRNLLERLRKYETETLRFMTDPLVPFTNNQGENDLRMTKVQQKISSCFRSLQGAQYFCRVRSYLSTCRKHGLAATTALRMLFSGQLPNFIPKPGKC
jgi:transposase